MTTLIVGDEGGLRSGSDKPSRPDRRRSKAPIDIPFGRSVRRRRTKLGLTQVELARQAGCHAITLSRIETGTSRLTDRNRLILDAVLTKLEGL